MDIFNITHSINYVFLNLNYDNYDKVSNSFIPSCFPSKLDNKRHHSFSSSITNYSFNSKNTFTLDKLVYLLFHRIPFYKLYAFSKPRSTFVQMKHPRKDKLIKFRFFFLLFLYFTSPASYKNSKSEPNT